MPTPPATISPAERRNNVAAFRVTLDGVDLTDRIAPRLLSLSLSEKRGEEADQLDMELDDSDGRLALPRTGAAIQLSIGWERGSDVMVGMIDKGKFVVDQVEHRGAPDRITVRARSADFTSAIRIRKDKSHIGTTLGEITKKVAAAHGLKPSVAPELASIPVPVLGQTAKSDIAMLRELGRKHDAVATIKAGRLILSPIGKGQTPSGKAIPAVTLSRIDGWQHRYGLVDRDKYEGVSASWHDQDKAKRKTVRAGGDGKAKRLPRTYATEADAKAASDAEWKRIQRGAAEFEYGLALGRPDLYPDRPVALKGWKAEIDAKRWLISEVTHRMDGNGGLATSLKLETAA